jgi:EAL domain-containing protein (putative c-di-GMP-specific phosphodiesterase class I)
MVEWIESILSELALHPSLLELELTESAWQLQDGVVDVLHSLKRLGVRLALDDFGTGYSSLGSLRSLPFERLKIDRSFITDMEHREDDRSLVRAIIAMGRSLKLAIVAEGVETPWQLNFLRNEGCHAIQGHLLGRPVSAADFDKEFPDRMSMRGLCFPGTKKLPRRRPSTIA